MLYKPTVGFLWLYLLGVLSFWNRRRHPAGETPQKRVVGAFYEKALFLN